MNPKSPYVARIGELLDLLEDVTDPDEHNAICNELDDLKHQELEWRDEYEEGLADHLYEQARDRRMGL